eukprot:SM000019S04973  [mRNA]  locus=s19:305030:308053:+ [translate_table: standard]
MGDYSRRPPQINRANVQQLKLIGQSHQTGLTSNLLKLFEPREPLEFKPPLENRPHAAYTGIAQFVDNFANPGEAEYAPPVTKGETVAEKRVRIRAARLEKGAEKLVEELEKYDPHKDPNIDGDPYKTLFVARISYETTETKLKRECEAYGPVKKIRLVHDNATQKPRGYAFIEYMHTRDMKTAYKQADGRKIDNRRVTVDVERGRTVPNWRPRRLGGGLGSTRMGGEEVNKKFSGREPQLAPIITTPRTDKPPPRVDDRPPREEEKDREREREREKERERADREERERNDLEREKEKERERLKEKEVQMERARGDRDVKDVEDGRQRDRDGHSDRGRDRERDHERERGGGSRYDKERDGRMERDGYGGGRGDRERDRDRDRDRGGHRDRDRERERDKDKHSDRHRERERDRERVDQPRGRERDRERDRDVEMRDKERGHDRREQHAPAERSHARDGARER